MSISRFFLTPSEVIVFTSDFFLSDISKVTKITITPKLTGRPPRKKLKYEVCLKESEFPPDLLEASFKDGLLRVWSRKFSN